MRIVRDLFLLAAGFGAIWLLFTYIPIIPDKDYFSIPISTEEELGESIFKYQIEQNPEFKLIESSYIDSVMEIVTARLLDAMEKPLFDFEFYVINSEEVNAFTIPGGKIFVFSGLIQLSESPEEIASVLAHELGHAQERHVLNKLAKQIGLSVLLSNDAFVLGEVTKTLGSTKFDRVQEEKADNFGFELMKDANLDPRHFASIMLKMSKDEPDGAELFELINTHPDSERRIKRALAYRLDKKFNEVEYQIDWQSFKDKLSAETKKE